MNTEALKTQLQELVSEYPANKKLDDIASGIIKMIDRGVRFGRAEKAIMRIFEAVTLEMGNELLNPTDDEGDTIEQLIEAKDLLITFCHNHIV